ncbi:hypothetical protein SAMN05444350_12362 [Bacteroides stercorirosoris]|uniref:Uncharacterized protein n=1 Tax=Bacteroides stercorirosoris TaxID=871324 RepID=A0A1M6IK96_9BACE|nr:hypothetical protein SAMN05444350_12362 [Bacteroides stercorirosoris]
MKSQIDALRQLTHELLYRVSPKTLWVCYVNKRK